MPDINYYNKDRLTEKQIIILFTVTPALSDPSLTLSDTLFIT